MLKDEITTSVNELSGFTKSKIDESLADVKVKLTSTAKEIEKQKDDFQFQGKLRKFFFWLTPIFLLVQTILLILNL